VLLPVDDGVLKSSHRIWVTGLRNPVRFLWRRRRFSTNSRLPAIRLWLL
jgi:hypothetical protein